MSIPGSQPEEQNQASTPYYATPPVQPAPQPYPQQNQWPAQQQQPYPQAQPAWPPPPGQGAPNAPWPPPAYGAPMAPQPFSMWFNALTERQLKGLVTDFRVGSLWFTDEGLILDGQAVMPAEQRLPIVLCFLIFGIGVIIASMIMEAAFRKQRQLLVPWDKIRTIAYTPKRDVACILFDAPSFYNPNKIKTFSLAFKLPAHLVEPFVLFSQQYVPDKVQQANIPNSSLRLLIVLLVLIGIMILLVAIASIHSGH